MTPQLCDNCNASGLPILPLRYAPVPATLSPALPSWASGHRVASVPLGDAFQYALRGMRAGYIYVFYAKNQFGTNQWDCWVVTADGALVKQANPHMAADAPPAALLCSRQGHSHARLHHLVIERPEKCGPCWMAFSQHKWSEDTLNEYAAHATLRNARMQTFHPSEMAHGAKHSHGTPATVSALEQVLDYAATPPDTGLPHQQPVSAFSQEDGRFDTVALHRVSTLYPWLGRRGQAQADVDAMQQRAQKADGTHNTPHLLALWDAVGITHELSGFCKDAAGRLAQYSEERALQIACSNYLQELQAAAASAAEGDANQLHAMAFSVTDLRQQGTGQGMRQLAAQHPNDPRYAEAAQLQTQWEANSVPSYYSQRMYMVLQHYPVNLWRGEINKLKTEVDHYLTNRGPNFQKQVAEVRLHAWDRFEKYLDTQGALLPFRRNWEAFQTRATQLMESRTAALVQWLEAPLLIDTLEDCRPTNLVDGVIFERYVGQGIDGMGASKAGVHKLDEWVKEAKASATNLLWRAIALNQNEGIADVNAALAAAEAARSDRTVATAFNVESVTAKVGKTLFGVYKSASGILKANSDVSSGAGDAAFGARLKAVNARGVDRILTNAGDAILRRFGVATQLADFLCEKIMQHLLSVRALISPEDSRTLIVYQAADEPAARGQLLKRLAAADAFMASASKDMAAAQSERLKSAWQRVAAGGDDKLRGPRIAALVILIEAMNFNKLLYDCHKKGDMKSWTSLAASGMTITSGLIDIASAPVKEELRQLGDKGAASWSMQRLKLAGGLLSVAATGIGVIWDGVSVRDSLSTKRTMLAGLYALKTFIGIGSVGLTAATTFTHVAPLLGKLWQGEAIQAAAGTAGARASAIIGARILFMSFGAWLSVGTFAIQLVIWMQPDDLQAWCERCAFGKSREMGWTPKQQFDELEKALKSIGIA